MGTASSTPVFDVAFTEAVCNVLAATDPPALTSSELISVLRVVRIQSLDEGANKRTRLLTTLHNAQVSRGTGKTLIGFVNAAMSPARYVSDPLRWEALRGQLNAVLVLYGLRVNEQGKLARGRAAATLSEAAQLSGELLTELRRRGCHAVLLNYCSEELLQQSLFHAVSEASKTIPDRIRRHTGLAGDGAALYDQALGSQNLTPLVQINSLASDSEVSEHRGFKNMLVGIHGHYRNPRAHRTRLGSTEARDDFLDAFSLFSYIHRRLDQAGVGA